MAGKGRGKSNENPLAHEFLLNNQALRVVNSIRIDTAKGNTRGTNQERITVVSDGPLQKRRRCSTASDNSVTAFDDSFIDSIPTSIKDTLKDDDDDDNEDQHHPKEWLNLINRGGLTKCSNDLYEHLHTVENEIQKVISPSTRKIPLVETTKKVAKSQIVQES